MTSDIPDSSITRRKMVQGTAAGVAAATIGTITSKEVAAQEAYDAIVVGTGFGGSIATIALSAHGKKILVIERGTFWITPEALGAPPAPSNATAADWARRKNLRVQYWPRPDHALGLLDLLANRYRDDNPYGLHNYRMFRQAHILTASGVGGGSLIYSNVNLRAQPAVLDRIGLKGMNYDRAEQFMVKYRGKLSTVVTKIPLPPGVSPEQLGDPKFAPVPDKDKLANKGYLLLDRSRALRDAAAFVSAQLGVQMPWTPLKLSVTEYVHGAEAEADGIHTFCERQGRCMLGCLPQARHTLNKTLYKWVLSKNEQVTLSPESEVRTIKRVGDSYEVSYVDRRGERGKERPQNRTARASQVFLAAGVLGTNEILLRSRRDGGLQLSDKLGIGFSTNGDFGALAVGTTLRTPDGKPVLTPDGKPAKMSVYPTRGPINTCDISFDMDGRHYTIEDAGIPSMFAKIVRTGLDDRLKLLALKDPASFVTGHTSSTITSLFASIKQRLFGSKAHDPTKDRHSTEAELIDDVFFFNSMGEDDADGFFYLKGDKLDLDWPANKPVGNHACFTRLEDMMRKLSQAMGGTYTPLPTWEGLPGVFDKKTLIVTHPLGGCRVGPTMAEGVVNEFGQVYDGSKKTTDPIAVHPGLFIVDGAAIPGALAANPTLTISAQAIKTVEKAVGSLPL